MDIVEGFKAQARKYNNYQETERTCGRKCINCFRWNFSFPYTCNDYDMYSDKAETCLNYNEDKNCKVD